MPKVVAEQGMLIEVGDPKYKELLKHVRAYKRKKDERSETLGTLKAAVDAAQERVVAEMRSLKLTSFVYDGYEVECSDGKTILVVKKRKDTNGNGDDEGESNEGEA